jgi:hypothetical protein
MDGHNLVDGLDPYIIAMCYYHVMAALKMQVHLLPQGKYDSAQMCHDVELLADTLPHLFLRAWACMSVEWIKRGWVAFSEYFQREWMNLHKYWSVSALGRGKTRTNCGLEGSWPIVHRFVTGVVTPIRLLETLVHSILPYFMRNPENSNRADLSLLERQEAVVLSMEHSDKLKVRTINGKQWFYCKKRVLGIGRPCISESDVDRYESALRTGEWEYTTHFLHVSHIRKFNESDCACAAQHLYGLCYHSRAAGISAGVVLPGPSEVPPGEGKPGSTNYRADRDVSQKVSTFRCTPCGLDCRNDHNRQSHVTGLKHRLQMTKLVEALVGNPEQLPWGNMTLDRVPGTELVRGDRVIVPIGVEVHEGIVSGRSYGKAHVAISVAMECMILADQHVYRVSGEAEGSVLDSPLPSPKTSNQGGSNRKPHSVSRSPAKPNPSNQGGTRKPARAKKNLFAAPTKDIPLNEYERMRQDKIDRNKAVLDEILQRQPAAVPVAPTDAKPAPTKSTGTDKAPARGSLKGSHPLYKARHWLSTADLVYVSRALTGCVKTLLMPMSYETMVRAIEEGMNDKNPKWHVATINTDDEHSAGLHWIVAMWLSGPQPKVVLWEPYGNSNISKHIKQVLEKRFPACKGRVKLFTVGLQKDGWSCGYFCLYWWMVIQRLVDNGSPPEQWSKPPDMPPGWRDLVYSLLRVRDLQPVGKGARASKVSTLFQSSLDSGTFTLAAFKGHLENYLKDMVGGKKTHSAKTKDQVGGGKRGKAKRKKAKTDTTHGTTEWTVSDSFLC